MSHDRGHYSCRLHNWMMPCLPEDIDLELSELTYALTEEDNFDGSNDIDRLIEKLKGVYEFVAGSIQDAYGYAEEARG